MLQALSVVPVIPTRVSMVSTAAFLWGWLGMLQWILFQRLPEEDQSLEMWCRVWIYFSFWTAGIVVAVSPATWPEDVRENEHVAALLYRLSPHSPSVTVCGLGLLSWAWVLPLAWLVVGVSFSNVIFYMWVCMISQAGVGLLICIATASSIPDEILLHLHHQFPFYVKDPYASLAEDEDKEPPKSHDDVFLPAEKS